MTFTTTPEQDEKIRDWIHWQEVDKPSKLTAIGGRYTYEFTPTGVGIVVKIKDAVTKEALDVSDYDLW